jgi:DeoR family transcriptional regulator of aga operon/DeoR family fructose operon transcriptional repressor
MKNLMKEERQQIILETLQENQRATVSELSQRFETSEVTIRRDLAALAARGKVMRTHRGALRAVPAPPESPVVQRMAVEHGLKEIIAHRALDLVKDGDAIFVGSGSSTSVFARLLPQKKSLTVVTNALNIASELSSCEEEITVIVTGGVVRPSELSLLGHIVELSLPEVLVNKVFMGVQALSPENGWTTDHIPEVTTTRRIIDMAPELVILADHTKLGCSAMAFIAPVTRIRTLITDAQADPEMVSLFEAKGVQVILAGK